MRGERAGDAAARDSAAARALGGRDGRGGRTGGEAAARFRRWEPLPIPVSRLCQDRSHSPCPQSPGGRGGKGWGSCPLPQGSCARRARRAWGNPASGGGTRGEALDPGAAAGKAPPPPPEPRELRRGPGRESPGGRRARPCPGGSRSGPDPAPRSRCFPGTGALRESRPSKSAWLTGHSRSCRIRAVGLYLLVRSPWLHRKCSVAPDYRNLAVLLKNGGFLLAVIQLCDAVIVEKLLVLSLFFTCGSLCPPKYLLLFGCVRTVQNKGAGRES